MYKYIIIYFCSLFITSCNTSISKENVQLTIEKNFTFTDSFNVIYLHNNNNQSVHFQFKINDLFPLEMKDIVRSIEDSSIKRNTLIEEEVWRYVSNTTFWSTPLTPENWQHNPILFLNSIGGGHCDDRASVLAATWRNWYDSVRIIGLNGHVVPEVKSHKKWKMYDPDRKVAYLNANNEICSVSELEDSAQYISNPTQQKVIGTNPVFQSNNPLSVRYSKLYATTYDNKDETSWHLNTKDLSSTFILPAYSSLKIEIDQTTHQVNLSVILSKKSKGEIHIPFVPYVAEGVFDCQFSGISKSIKDSLFYFPTDKWINSIDIKNVKSKSIIRYLINPKLKFYQPENRIKLKSNVPLEIFKKQEDISPYLPFEFAAFLYFDKKVIEYNDFLKHLTTININNTITSDFLNKQYNLFLKVDKTLTTKDVEKLQIQFQTDLKELNFQQKEKEFRVINNLYPQSVLYLLIASKNRKIDILKFIIMKEK